MDRSWQRSCSSAIDANAPLTDPAVPVATDMLPFSFRVSFLKVQLPMPCPHALNSYPGIVLGSALTVWLMVWPLISQPMRVNALNVDPG